jgi:hypothetical protein
MQAQALLRFDEIFGTATGQIGPADQIVSARLELEVSNQGHNMQLHRMLQDWTSGATWNHFGGDGIQADNVEAVTLPDAVGVASGTGRLSIDVTATLRAWQQDSATNRGWVLLPTGTNGVDFDSAEGTIPPRLVVEVAGSIGPLELYDASGQQLAQSTVAGTNAGQVIARFVPPAAGTYLARVAGPTRGDYHLLVIRNATFDLEPNDDPTMAQPVARTTYATGYVTSTGGSGDADFYAIEVAAADRVHVRALVPAAESGQFVNGLDPVIGLLDPAGNTLVVESGGELTHTAIGTGLYTVGIVADIETAGEYALHIVVVAPGDMNLDGHITAADVDDFVLGLVNGPQYEATYGVPAALAGDTDGDGDLDFDDIQGFTALVIDGQGTGITAAGGQDRPRTIAARVLQRHVAGQLTGAPVSSAARRPLLTPWQRLAEPRAIRQGSAAPRPRHVDSMARSSAPRSDRLAGVIAGTPRGRSGPTQRVAAAREGAEAAWLATVERAFGDDPNWLD